MLIRKNECHPDTTTAVALACVALHNICIDKGDAIPSGIDLNLDENGRVPSLQLRSKLMMVEGTVRDTTRGAQKIRDALKSKFWSEHPQ